jgi:hypothetical protein
MLIKTAIPLSVLLAVIVAPGCSGSPTSYATDDGGDDSAVQGDSNGNGQDSGTDSGVTDTGVSDSVNAPEADAAADGDDGGGTYDFGCGGNTACQITDVCCTATGSTVSFSCVPQASCTAADKISCDGPDECVGTATPICCGVQTTNGMGNYPQCNPAALGTSCTTSDNCPTHLGQNCTDTTTVVLCHVKADCTDSTNNKCCTFTSGGASLTFCIDGVTAGLAGAKCH